MHVRGLSGRAIACGADPAASRHASCAVVSLGVVGGGPSGRCRQFIPAGMVRSACARTT